MGISKLEFAISRQKRFDTPVVACRLARAGASGAVLRVYSFSVFPLLADPEPHFRSNAAIFRAATGPANE
ncbi:hypothetical protein KUV26_00030 [Leisingera daeponensis]|uniref:Uncharacterized protein n=1 Tax=Leisingera daeponensis TaxID=405746 RepID=A0ABS7N9D1_9RHOB|nr:hypothetical protein [Leisingera daeponensis]MBY6137817.1 hypothetical protein [Leisingera daeponensis]